MRERIAMRSTTLELGEDLIELLANVGEPIEHTAREMIVIELYRRNLISSGRAAELMGISRLDFIRRAADLGIPYFRFTDEELRAEIAQGKRL
jgi:predicted HTH domain antitoxin